MAPEKPEESERRPDVVPGDEVFFNHPAGPLSGRVTACGEHGATIDCQGTTHKMRWPHILGHKKRASQEYTIEESGEDGHIVRDAAGNRRYVGIPNEAREDPLIAKAQGGGTPFAGRPGLTKKKITDKLGRQETKWVRANKEQPKERGKAAPKAAGGKGKPGAAPEQKPAAKRGDKVNFKVGAFSGQGTVVGRTGKLGAYVRDSSGHDHKVKWSDMRGVGKLDPNARPEYEPRNAGEKDKEYAKRAIDNKTPLPKSLPEEHDKYFQTENSKRIPLDKLHSPAYKAAEAKESGENGVRRMHAAYHGVLSKRAPITVMPHKDPEMAAQGHHEIVDGNGTYNSAKGLGWGELPASVVDRKTGEASQLADIVKGIAEAAVNPAKFPDLPVKGAQPENTQEGLYAKAHEALDQLQDWLNRGKGVASQAGFKRMNKSPGDMTPEEWAANKSFLFIAGLKAADGRAQEKVRDDYGGDWSKLMDVVRCTLAVDSLHDMNEIMEKLTASGMKLMQRPKNSFLKPTPQGYRDINLVVQLPNGMAAEVQLNVKDMLQAKNEGHEYYEITREIQGRNDKAGVTPPNWSDEDKQRYQEANDKQVEIYGNAWAEHIQKPFYKKDSNMIKSASRKILIWTSRSNI